MALTKIGTENIVKSDERIIMSVKQKYWSNLFTNGYKKRSCPYVSMFQVRYSNYLKVASKLEVFHTRQCNASQL